MGKQHIVVLGAGFGGLAFAKKLKAPDTEVTIVDQQNHHLFQPLLYQVATAGLALPDIAEPVRTIFSDQKHIRVLMERVTGIDCKEQKVCFGDRSLPYDKLVVGLGMVNDYFGNDEWAHHTIGMKSLREARKIRQLVLNSFEKAEACDDPEERSRLMTIVVIGGGPTGVEMAGALGELTKRAFKKDFRRIRPEESRIVLVEAGPRVLPGMSERSSDQAARDLRKLGVELYLNAPVKAIEHGIVRFPGHLIQSESIIWTAGVRANPVVDHLPGVKDRKGRVIVRSDLSIRGYSNIFVIGDIAAVKDKKGNDVPGVSPAAIQMGKHVAANLNRERKAEVRGKPSPARKPFSYWDKGTMATVGRSSAVAEIGPLHFHGFPAWGLWLFVHLVFLIGFRNRLAVLLKWIYAYAMFRPGARVFEETAAPKINDTSEQADEGVRPAAESLNSLDSR